MSADTPPGWYPDPERADTARYWNGERWTGDVRPVGAPPPPPPPPNGGGSSGKRNNIAWIIAGAAAAVALGVAAALFLRSGGDDQEQIQAPEATEEPATTAPPATTTTAATERTTTTVSPATTASPPTTTPVVGGQAPQGFVRTFETYVRGINQGDYARAYAMLGPNAQALTSFAEFVDGNETSQISGFTVDAVRPVGQGLSDVDVSFVSNQAASKGPDGQTCTEWQLTYRMVALEGAWRIDRADTRGGTPRAC